VCPWNFGKSSLHAKVLFEYHVVGAATFRALAKMLARLAALRTQLQVRDLWSHLWFAGQGGEYQPARVVAERLGCSR
jgi:hypothetical protein